MQKFNIQVILMPLSIELLYFRTNRPAWRRCHQSKASVLVLSGQQHSFRFDTAQFTRRKILNPKLLREGMRITRNAIRDNLLCRYLGRSTFKVFVFTFSALNFRFIETFRIVVLINFALLGGFWFSISEEVRCLFFNFSPGGSLHQGSWEINVRVPIRCPVF